MPPTIFPKPLAPGDHLRVIAPSSSLDWIAPENRRAATERLEQLGFSVSFGRYADDVDHFGSASVDKRLHDLHEAFLDPSVDGVLSATGGYNANDLLPHLHWECIRSNPKVLCGYSDITALTSAITAMTGLITFSGQHYSTFAMREFFEQGLEWFITVVMDRRTARLDAAAEWADDSWYRPPYRREPEPNSGHWVLAGGVGRGRIEGGNLCTLNLLQGTPWMPELADTVLFVEDDAEATVEHFARNLASLRHQSGFDQLDGLVIGRFQRASKIERSDLAVIIDRLRLPTGVPVVANVDVGHTDPMAVLPIGGQATVQAEPGGATEITVSW